MAAKIPESIGKYRVRGLLAQGGMGAVYTAEHPTLERTVIIKKLTLRGSANVRERFRREAQIMMDLRNDAIVDVYDHFREGSFYYIVLEYVDGVSLDRLIRERRYLPERIAILILREAARGLAYAHGRNVVHRDIKPANILVSTTGEVKIVDFGIATIHGNDGQESELTREGMTLGTPSYMAPEQFQSSRSVDRRADIYSLGIVWYEMVTGKRPYPSSFTPEVIVRIQRGRYRSPRKVNPRVSRFSTRTIHRMLRPKVKHRISDLDRVIRRLTRRLKVRSHVTGCDEIRRYLENESALQRSPRLQRQIIAGVASAILVFLAAGLGIQQDYHREVFQPDTFGAILPTVRIRKDGRPLEEVTPTGMVFLDDGDETPAVPAGALQFEVIPEEESPRFYVFRSGRVVLPAAEYRIKIATNGTVQWRSFTLPSFSETRPAGFSFPGRSETAFPIGAEFVEVPTLPLVVDVVVRDRASNNRIEEGVAISVMRDDRWRPLTPFSMRFLRSGELHRFRIVHEAYDEQVFSVEVAPEESFLFLDIGLTPKE
jgi:predicted Ser/Thr protein kinase